MKTRLHDCDRRILLNHARQDAMIFVRNGTRDSADAMIGLKSDMDRLQIERAEAQSEVIAQRNVSLQPTATA
jgi:hypothetical protein